MSSSTFQTNYSLLRRAVCFDDHQAWEELVVHYERFIIYILRKQGVLDNDLEDVSQQILVALTKSLENYDSQKGSFRSWLAQLIRNQASNYFRKEIRSQKYLGDFAESDSAMRSFQLSDVEKMIEKEWISYVSNIAMSRVRGAFQGKAFQVFELFLAGYSSGHIAEETSLSLHSVYTLKKRVKKRLYFEIRAVTAELEL